MLVITDYNRVTERTSQHVSIEELQVAIKANLPAPEDEVVDKLDSQWFWSWISQKLNDQKERLVMQGIFVLALKPRELCDYYEKIFTDVEEVYRIKQNVLARLRRDEEFRKFLGEGD